MKVRTLKDHANDYGVRDGLPYEKKVGRTYEIGDAEAQPLIEAGLVEKADKADAKPQK